MMEKVMIVLCMVLVCACDKDTTDITSTQTEVTAGNGELEAGNESPASEVKIKKTVLIRNRKKKDSTGYSEEGTWEESSLPGFKGDISRYSSDPLAQVSYETSQLAQGRYCLSVFRVTHPNSIDKSQYSIFDGNSKLQDVVVNHKLDTQEKGWSHLGVFTFSDSDGKVILSRGQGSDGGVLRADDIRFRRLKSEDFDCLGRVARRIGKKSTLNNKTGKKMAGYRESGEWNDSSLLGHKNLGSRYSLDPNAFATFTVKAKAQREYCIKTFKVAHANSSDEIKIEVSLNGQSLGYELVDFTAGPSEWVSVMSVNVLAKDIVEVKITRQDSNDGKVLRADAVAFTQDLAACTN